MKSKGFTLIELLGVIVIIAVISSVVFPAVTGILKKSRKTVYDNSISEILKATYDYTLTDTSLLSEYDNTNYITLNELIKKGYIENNLINTETNEVFSNDLVISIKNIGKNFDVDDISNYIIKGNYLYIVEIDRMNEQDYDDNRPNIIIEDYEESSNKQINVGSTFSMPNVTATSASGEVITNMIVTNIVYQPANPDEVNSKINIEEIDTSNSGIYYINYCVVDKEGYSVCKTLNLIVNDSISPVLTVPGSATISASETNFDLREGVSCTDNSGKAYLKVNGNIQYGVVGSYKIEYLCSDPTGKTESAYRIINIE